MEQTSYSKQAPKEYSSGSGRQCGHNQADGHEHGKLPVILYFIGLAVFIAALFLKEKSLIQNVLYLTAMIMTGYHITAEGFSETYHETIEKKRFSPNVHILMTLAAVGAMIIGDFFEGSLLILIFSSSHFLEEYAEGKSKREISNLMSMNPTEARLLDDEGHTTTVSVKELKIGDRLQVLNGDQIPTDGVIISGISSIDESSISGESIPREKAAGDEVFGSTINGTGTFVMEVTKDSSDTLFAKIIDLVNQSQSNQSKTATKIQKLEPIYVNTVLIIVPLFILLGGTVLGWSWYQSFYKGMVFLTVASPCALAASAVPATLSAISNLAKKGVLFKGGSFLANFAGIQAIAFDKTGTLTKGEPKVTDVYFIDDVDEQATVNVIVAMEQQANHPLAHAILENFEADKALNLEVENMIGRGLTAKHFDDEYEIGKPSGFENVPEKIAAHNVQYAEEGKTVVYVAKNNEVVGLIAMMDVPNEHAKGVISYLKEQGIHTVMITGDSEKTGRAVGDLVGIDEVIGNVLPENKSIIVNRLKKQYGIVAMLGDGVNDAPAIVESDIGIAMGEGTDVAMDVADAVLMQNDLRNLAYTHQVSKKLDKVVWQNIFFAMAVVVILVVLNFIGKMNLPIGVLFHEGSTVLVILNGLRLLAPVRQTK
ncbi:heavy metal translocating P-type ATPase [Vagococcus elongatus]|uniref:Heavy metal translocating P-type ATPase n=1 Tax=Vagococcus elongatus TaxID=180344 RepID=A0A430B1Y4_9ENTE|nr:heavy metal translocating P-type ATPase [Vagococcus elongatus]RSU14336.1 heavy metal translocating P-type ATPase [Vagococcus elongatus]